MFLYFFLEMEKYNLIDFGWIKIFENINHLIDI